MIAFLMAVGILFVACVIEVFFQIPVIQSTHQALDQLFRGRGYARFFVGSLLISVCVLVAGTLVLAPFLSINGAIHQIGGMFLFFVLIGFLKCYGALFSRERALSTSSSVAFVSALWGSLLYAFLSSFL